MGADGPSTQSILRARARYDAKGFQGSRECLVKVVVEVADEKSSYPVLR